MSHKSNGPRTRGVHHVGLTIPNLDTSRKFFIDVLGFEQVGELPDYPAVFISDGSTMITLWQVSDPINAIPFDRKKVIGLHHLALNVENDAALDEIHETLINIDDVKIEFAPEPLHEGPVRHMMCNIPGGVRVEFIAANS